MNKYLLIIAAMAAFGGFSNMFSAAVEEKACMTTKTLFMDDLYKGHDRKMMLASGLVIGDWALFGFDWPKKPFNCIIRNSIFMTATGLGAYSVGKTLYDRSKQQ